MKIQFLMKDIILLSVILFISIQNAYASNDTFFVIPPSSTQTHALPISIPVTMNNLSNLDIRAIELNISYDPDVLTATGVSLTGTVLEDESYLYAFNTNISGIIYALFASNASYFTGTGLCLNLDFTVIGSSGETSEIAISKAIVNNQYVSTSGGVFTVTSDDRPTFTGIMPHTINEDTSLSTIFTITDYETNPCDLTLTIISSDETVVPANTISYTCMSGEYTFSITPVEDQNGLVTITFIAEDSGGLTASASFDLTVVSVNDPPVLANPILDRIATEGIEYTFTFNANVFVDADMTDILTYSAAQSNGSALPSWLTFDSLTRTFNGLPTSSDVGAVTITVTATDSAVQSVSDTFVLHVNNTNSAPVLDIPIADQTVSQDEAFAFTFAADTFRDEDVAFGDTLSYTAKLADGTALPLWLTFDGFNRHFSGTPTNYDVGMYTITVVAKDTLNLTAMDSFYLTVINVNDAPEISDIFRGVNNISVSGLTIDEDSWVNDISFSVYDMDADDTHLTVSFVSSNTTLVPLSNMVDTCISDSCTMSLTPNSDESGSAIITVIVTDSHGQTASNTFGLIVNATNDPPTISSVSEQTVEEDTTISGISLTVSDIEDAPCSMDLIVTSSDTMIIPDENISFTCSANTYMVEMTPSANQHGVATITAIIKDSSGLISSTSFDVIVTPVNDMPSLSFINDQFMDEGSTIDIPLTTSDIEGDLLSVTALSADQSLIQDSAIQVANDGYAYTITITPTEAHSGSTIITVSVDDGTDTTQTTFNITVSEVNYIIAGHISNYIDGSDLQGVTMSLIGTHSYSMETDADGYYTFTTVRPGDYTLTASKSDNISLDISDAIKILKAGARNINLSCLEQIAADAYLDGFIGAYDAAKVAIYAAGINNCLNDNCTFYQFVTENITSCETWPLIEFDSVRRYTDLTGDALGQDFIGIGCGNVSE